MLSAKTEAGDIASQAKENEKHAPANFARHDEAMNEYRTTVLIISSRYSLLLRVRTFSFEIKKS